MQDAIEPDPNPHNEWLLSHFSVTNTFLLKFPLIDFVLGLLESGFFLYLVTTILAGYDVTKRKSGSYFETKPATIFVL